MEIILREILVSISYNSILKPRFILTYIKECIVFYGSQTVGVHIRPEGVSESNNNSEFRVYRRNV